MSASATPVRARRHRPGARDGVRLAITLRRSDGELLQGALAARTHQELHLRMLHAHTRGLVEIAAGPRDHDGELHIYTRRRRDHFLPGGGTGDPRWLARILAVVDWHLERHHDVFVGPAIHARRSASREAIHATRWLWLDIDGPEHLARVDTLLAAKPAAARVYSGGSGGEHVYFPLRRAIPARTVTVDDGARTLVNPREVTVAARGARRLAGYCDPMTGEVLQGQAVHWIERANLRLIHRLGTVMIEGEQRYVADVKCRNRTRLMRLAGTVHGGSGEHARISYLHLGLPAYDPQVLVGDLPDPRRPRAARPRGLHRFAPDPLKQIPAEAYFRRLAGIELPAHGNISCPNPAHQDVHPSCSVSDYVWCCHGCSAHGTIIDLWSVLHGGPTGDELAALPKQEFRHIRQEAAQAMGL